MTKCTNLQAPIDLNVQWDEGPWLWDQRYDYISSNILCECHLKKSRAWLLFSIIIMLFPKPWFLEPYCNFYHFYNFCNSVGPKLLCRFHLFLLSPNFILSVAEKILCSETIAKEVSQLHSSNSLLTEKSFNIKYGKM